MTERERDTSQLETTVNCCMCGDSGLSHELFRCKTCRFRSQHRYCSNLYPKSESYNLCNWCLSQSEDTKPGNSSITSSCRGDVVIVDKKIKKKKEEGNSGNDGGGALVTNKSRLQACDRVDALKINGDVMKKNGSSPPETSTKKKTRRRVVTRRKLEEMMKMRKTRSEEISRNRSNGRLMVRSKVRRYKLLDEVSN